MINTANSPQGIACAKKRRADVKQGKVIKIKLQIVSIRGILALAEAALFLSYPALASAKDIVDQAEAINWTRASLPDLRKLFPDIAVVSNFYNLNEMRIDPNAANDIDHDQVGEFEFIDLNNDGHIELACTIDSSSRAFYTHLAVFSRVGGKLKVTKAWTDGANMLDLKQRTVDLNHDGRLEFLVPRQMEEYAGVDPVAVFTNVYTFEAGRLVQSDSRFLSYYENTRLPEIRSKIDQLEKGNQTDDSIPKWLHALRVEAQAIEDLLRGR
jgi:hypothetical protein